MGWFSKNIDYNDSFATLFKAVSSQLPSANEFIEGQKSILKKKQEREVTFDKYLESLKVNNSYFIEAFLLIEQFAYQRISLKESMAAQDFVSVFNPLQEKLRNERERYLLTYYLKFKDIVNDEVAEQLEFDYLFHSAVFHCALTSLHKIVLDQNMINKFKDISEPIFKERFKAHVKLHGNIMINNVSFASG